jgi:hemerythrin-like metal-binding protein
MAYLAWRVEMEVGHGRIDEDHRTLVDAMNQLRAALDRGMDREGVAKVLGFLRDYTVSHFGMEEALMREHGYPQALAHLAAHAELLLKVSEFTATYRRGGFVSIPDLLAFLEAWLLNHIQIEDRALGMFLKGPGA